MQNQELFTDFMLESLELYIFCSYFSTVLLLVIDVVLGKRTRKKVHMEIQCAQGLKLISPTLPLLPNTNSNVS